MSKIPLTGRLPFIILREGKYFIAYTPLLDLSTSAESFDEVKKRFGEVVRVFFEELYEKGTTDTVLSNLGWRKVQSKWSPPKVVAHEVASIKLPLTV